MIHSVIAPGGLLRWHVLALLQERRGNGGGPPWIPTFCEFPFSFQNTEHLENKPVLLLMFGNIPVSTQFSQ